MPANGLYGNNTDLASTVFVQTGQSIAVSGQWFNPGTASLFWDDTVSLGTAEYRRNRVFQRNLSSANYNCGAT